MARSDMAGFFWDDTPAPKPPKAEKPKRTPPARTWEDPSYLPGLEEAQRFDVPLFTDMELAIAARCKERLVFDIECYANYFLVAFQSLVSGKVTFVERFNGGVLDVRKLHWILHNFTVVSFNGINYDAPIVALALAGKGNDELKYATNEIIVQGKRPSDVLRSMKVKPLRIDHIDLIEVAPLRASLKIYGGRLHAKKMQDLPFHPETWLSVEQATIVRYYCVNDLANTALLSNSLSEQVALRETLSAEYMLDLRSRSDAQIAESVISEELQKLSGHRIERPSIEVGTVYRYKVPHFIQYQSELMRWALGIVARANFIVGEEGNVGMPAELKELKLHLAGGVYRMGIGGLHSSETSTAHFADADTALVDRDVTSYYPQIILNQGLYPHHLGTPFLKVYQALVNRRLHAKRSGNKVVADSLKITINGSFGKLGSKYSVLYSPDLLIQVTVTGQLSLLMLIERLEMQGIHVVSANTDGIVIKYPRARRADLEAVIAQWEKDTHFETEETEYRAVYSRDVNNYIAVKPNGEAKTKGAFGKVGLQKNPTNQICTEAVIALVTKGVPLATTIRGCTDIRKFCNVRTVKGGAVKDGTYLGKSIRWYYRAGEAGDIIYAETGNRVARSEGAWPLMELPDQFPSDVDFEWYMKEAESMLADIGYSTGL
jgi:hypothetical protein